MAARPDNISTLNLALELLKRIPRRSKISSTELQSQLKAAGIDRDLRSIQRQLGALCRSFDIERDENAGAYGYR